MVGFTAPFVLMQPQQPDCMNSSTIYHSLTPYNGV